LFVLSAALLNRSLQADAEMTPQLQASAMMAMPFLAVALASPAIIVAWHRVIIRDAAASLLPAPIGAAFLYFVRAILIGLILPLTVGLVGLLPIVYVGKMAIDPNLKFAVEAGLVAGAAILGLLITARLLLVLPAGAVGDWSVNFAKSWRLTAGNSWRMAAGFLLAAAPLVAVNVATNLFFSAVQDAAVAPSAAIVVLTLSIVLSLATAILEASFLSLAYIFFIDQTPRAN